MRQEDWMPSYYNDARVEASKHLANLQEVLIRHYLKGSATSKRQDQDHRLLVLASLAWSNWPNGMRLMDNGPITVLPASAQPRE
jgi:hypothetical protein